MQDGMDGCNVLALSHVWVKRGSSAGQARIKRVYCLMNYALILRSLHRACAMHGTVSTQWASIVATPSCRPAPASRLARGTSSLLFIYRLGHY
jgi:hypothetical protein